MIGLKNDFPSSSLSEWKIQLEKELKGQKRGNDVLNIIKKMRKSMFGNKNTVLKNDFYNGISKSNTHKLKKDGAISGCTMMVMK